MTRKFEPYLNLGLHYENIVYHLTLLHHARPDCVWSSPDNFATCEGATSERARKPACHQPSRSSSAGRWQPGEHASFDGGKSRRFRDGSQSGRFRSRDADESSRSSARGQHFTGNISGPECDASGWWHLLFEFFH